MPPAAAGLAARLECLADRLPKFRAALLAQPHGSLQLMTAQRGDVLLRRGDTAHALYVIADGLLRATVARADGREFTLSELRIDSFSVTSLSFAKKFSARRRRRRLESNARAGTSWCP